MNFEEILKLIQMATDLYQLGLKSIQTFQQNQELTPAQEAQRDAALAAMGNLPEWQLKD